MVAAIAVKLDNGAIVFQCGGMVRKHGDPRMVQCGQRLFTWHSEVASALDSHVGCIVTKCRRCKEENEAHLGRR